MRDLTQGQTAQPLTFLMVDATDHVTPETGLSPTVTLSKNGAAFAAPAGAVTEIGSGWYKVAGNATDSGTLGPLILHAEAAGADPTDREYAVVAFNPQDSVRLGLSALPAVAPALNGGLPVLSGGGTTLGYQVTGIAGTTQSFDALQAALNAAHGSGSWETVLGATAPAGWINAAAFAASAINAAAFAADAAAEIAAAVETAIVNEGDLTAVLEAIRVKIETSDDDLTTDLIRNSILDRVLPGNHDAANSVGAFLQKLDALISSRMATFVYTAPDNAGIAAIDDFLDTEIASIKAVTDKLNTGLVLDGAVWQWTINALELGPAGGGGGGGATAAQIWNYLTIGPHTEGSFGALIASWAGSGAVGCYGGGATPGTSCYAPMTIDIFNPESRPVTLAKANEPYLGTQKPEWFFGMLVAIGLRAVRLLGRECANPTASPFAVTDTVTVLRDSTSAARVRVSNAGPAAVTISYGEAAPVVGTLGSIVLAAGEYADTPCPVVGKIRAITAAGQNAAVTTTVFC